MGGGGSRVDVLVGSLLLGPQGLVLESSISSLENASEEDPGSTGDCLLFKNGFVSALFPPAPGLNASGKSDVVSILGSWGALLLFEVHASKISSGTGVRGTLVA